MAAYLISHNTKYDLILENFNKLNMFNTNTIYYNYMFKYFYSTIPRHTIFWSNR